MRKEFSQTPVNCEHVAKQKYVAQRASVLSAGRFGKYLKDPLNTPHQEKKSRWYFITKQ